MIKSPGPDTPQANDERLALPSSNQVGALARIGAMWTLMLTFSNQIISIASTTILSRLLLPRDYGIVGMVGTLTALLSTIAGLGLIWSTIQRRDLTLKQVHNLFWISSSLGILLWGLCAGTAPLLAAFYGQPEVAPVARVVGATFALNGLASQPMALLLRAMRFKTSTVIELIASALGATVAIVLAIRGAGYWAIIVSGIVGQGTRTLLAFGLTGYRPRRPQPDPATRTMVSFGGFVVLSSLVNYAFRNSDNIMIGREWGPTALGFYSRAYFLMTVPAGLLTGILNGVMVPALSALAHDRDRMGAAYRQAIRALAFTGFPIAIGLAVAAPQAVRLIYGPAWGKVVPILVVFSVSLVLEVMGGTHYWLYLATGRTRLQFWVGLVTTTVAVAGMLVGVQYDPIGVAVAVAIASAVIALPTWWLAHRIAHIPFARTLADVRPLLLAALIMGAGSLAAGLLVESLRGEWLLILFSKILVGAIIYGLIALKFLTPWPVPILERIRQRALRFPGRHASVSYHRDGAPR